MTLYLKIRLYNVCMDVLRTKRSFFLMLINFKTCCCFAYVINVPDVDMPII
jgi:hypothetical protein